MHAARPVAPADPQLPYHCFSDACQDAIYDTQQFFRSRPAEPVTLADLKRVVDQTLDNDHDPTERMGDARKRCRYGALVGTVEFIRQELSGLLEAAHRKELFAGQDAPAHLEASLLRQAMQATERCFTDLQQYNVKAAHDHFASVRETLHQIRLLPRAESSQELARVTHASALARQMLEYAAGK